MLETPIVNALIKDTQHLPDSAFDLWYADHLAHQALQTIEQTPKRFSRCKLIEEIELTLASALELFSQDKKRITPEHKNWLVTRKYSLDENIKKLQVKHIKMLIKELEVVGK